jgi:hypothetical protein
MNRMKQVAELLGLEWDDEKGVSEIFEIVSDEPEWVDYSTVELKDVHLNERGLKTNPWTHSHILLNYLLNGRVKIKKIPRMPKVDEIVYLLDLNYQPEGYYIRIWEGDETDMQWLKEGRVRCTEEEMIELVGDVKHLLEIKNPYSK